MPTNVRDPRSIITPEAFGIAPELLGTPLAHPWRRFWALMVDLLVVALLTAFLDSIQLFIWGVVGLVFLRVALARRQQEKTGGGTVVMRLFSGCLGATVLAIVLIVWLVASGDGGDDDEEAAGDDDVPASIQPLVQMGQVMAGREMLTGAEDAGEAVDVAADLLGELPMPGSTDEERLELLRDMTPADAPWAEDADSLWAVALERWRSTAGPEERGEAAEAAGSADDDREVVEEVAAMSEAEAAEAWAGLVRERRAAEAAAEADTAGVADAAGPPPPDPRLDALRRRLAGTVAADTLAALAETVEDLEEEVDEREEDLAELREDLEEERGDIGSLARDVFDQLGSAIGLWSLYFTVLLTSLRGQTVGKKLMQVRVLRLDGQPMTWWSSFERSGGYVAGLATGLLGFAQVFWDPNRQCIHDKIVGTVVVTEGAARVPGAWQEAHGTAVKEV